MPTSATGMKMPLELPRSRADFQSGFTLIEVLIVLMIISVVLTLITLNFSAFSTDKSKLDRAIQTLSYQIQWAQEKSLMTQSTYRIVFDVKTYRFERFDQNKQTWKVLDEPKSMRKVSLDTWSITALNEQKVPIHEIVFSPNQDMMPFKIILSIEAQMRTLQLTQEGQLRIENEAL